MTTHGTRESPCVVTRGAGQPSPKTTHHTRVSMDTRVARGVWGEPKDAPTVRLMAAGVRLPPCWPA